MPVNTLCYINTNLMCDNTSSLKTMLKFALFLFLGNGLSFFGNSLATIQTPLTSKVQLLVMKWLRCSGGCIMFFSAVSHSHSHSHFSVLQTSSYKDEKECVEGLW